MLLILVIRDVINISDVKFASSMMNFSEGKRALDFKTSMVAYKHKNTVRFEDENMNKITK